MPPCPAGIAESFPAVGLGDVETVAALQDRVDTKYVLSLSGVAALAERLLGTHAVLEIDGRRAFRYHSTYFDTAELTAFRDHLQDRRRRFKCRSCEHVDMVIVESKSPRGNATVDRELRALGARPEAVCSKYCIGVGFTHQHVKSNRLRPLLRAHVRAAPVATVALALGAAPATTAARPLPA